MAMDSMASFKPAISKAFQPLVLIAKLIERPAAIVAVLISGRLSYTVTAYPLFFKIIANNEPTKPAPKMEIERAMIIHLKRAKYG
jgi:hypothetical protein